VTPGSALRFRALIMAVLWAAVSPDFVYSQVESGDTPSSGGPKVVQPADDKRKDEIRAPQLRKVDGATSLIRNTNASFAPNPNAKWACDNTEVTHEPVWRGMKDLTFSFDIRNAGTEDLRIRAKGG
jgi:hypothetical protein